MKLFLDANVIYSAAKSESGASFAIFQLKEKYKLILISSRLALVEAERNIVEKENHQVIERFYRLIRMIKIILADSAAAKKYYQGIIDEKDAPILYAARKSQAEFLITLDRRHFFTKIVKNTKLSFKIKTPGEFIMDLR